MPAKKAAKPTSDNGAEGGKFSWTAENERKLMLLTQTFPTLSSASVDRLLQCFPGTNENGIKIRYSRLRVEGAKLRTELGLDVEGGNGEKAPVTPKRRKQATKDEHDDTPKSGRAKKVKQVGELNEIPKKEDADDEQVHTKAEAEGEET